MRRGNTVSIKQLNANAQTETDENGNTTTTVSLPTAVNDIDDVEQVITTMINNDTILDENDVNELIDAKLTDYTTTNDLQNDYTTTTLLTNTLDNYVSKELLSQSLSDRPTFTTTDALESTATEHENRIKGLEDNFVSTTSLVEILTNKADLSHTHLISDLNYDASNNLKSVIDGKALSNHTHTLSEITDYTPTDLSGVENSIAALSTLCEEDINELTEQVLEIENSLSNHTHSINDITGPDGSLPAMLTNLQTTLNNKAASSHTHTLSQITDYTAYDDSNCAKLNAANTFSGAITSTSTIVGTNVKSDNETRLATVENDLSSHKHTLSDITDYTATDLSNCAKLNTDNTYTGTQTFNASFINHLVSTMGSGNSIYKYMGKSTSSAESFRIRYYYNSTAANTYAQVGINGGSMITIYTNKIESGLPITSSSTIVGTNVKSDNETRLATVETAIGVLRSETESNLSSHKHTLSDITDYAATDLSNCAKLNADNTFSGTYIYHLRSTMDSGGSLYKYMGKSTSAYESFKIRYYYNSTAAHTFAEVGINGGYLIKIYANNIDTSLPITSSSTIVGTNVKSDNETRLAACEKAIPVEYSSDFNSGTIPVSGKWFGIAYGNGKFVAVAESLGQMLYSNDGINWNINNTGLSYLWRNIAYGNGYFVAVIASANAGQNPIYYSTDGINWNATGAYAYSLNICYGNGYFIMLDKNTMRYSTTSSITTWNTTTISGLAAINTINWDNIRFFNNQFVAVGTGYIAICSGSIFAWTYKQLSSGSMYKDIAYGNGTWVAVGRTTQCAYSTDNCQSWLYSDIGLNAECWCISFGNGKFVAFGYNTNYGAISTNGINWTKFTLTESVMRKCCCYGNGTFVSLSYNGTTYDYGGYQGYTYNDKVIIANNVKADNERRLVALESIFDSNDNLTLISPNMESDSFKYIYLGQDSFNLSSSGCISYYHNSTMANRYLKLALVSNPGIKIYYNYLQFDSKSYFNNSIYQLNDYITSTNYYSYLIGKNDGDKYCGKIYYYFGGDSTTDALNNSYLSLGLKGYPALNCYYDKITTKLPINIINPNQPITKTIEYLKVGYSYNTYGYGALYFYRGNSDNDNTISVGLTGGQYITIRKSAITASASISVSSDRRLKENITELSTDDTNIIDNIKVYSFNMKKDDEKRIHYGVIAQELQQIAPELVYGEETEDQYLAVDYTGLIPHLINKVKQQDKIINQLNNKLNKLYELLGITEAE